MNIYKTLNIILKTKVLSKPFFIVNTVVDDSAKKEVSW